MALHPLYLYFLQSSLHLLFSCSIYFLFHNLISQENSTFLQLEKFLIAERVPHVVFYQRFQSSKRGEFEFEREGRGEEVEKSRPSKTGQSDGPIISAPLLPLVRVATKLYWSSSSVVCFPQSFQFSRHSGFIHFAILLLLLLLRLLRLRICSLNQLSSPQFPALSKIYSNSINHSIKVRSSPDSHSVSFSKTRFPRPFAFQLLVLFLRPVGNVRKIDRKTACYFNRYS